MFKTLQWEDWAGIAVGVWMLASPWVLGYADHYAATVNAGILGTALVIVAVAALTILLAALALSPLDEKIRLWWREH